MAGCDPGTLFGPTVEQGKGGVPHHDDAALYYFKFRKPKADTTGHDDLDEYDFGEDEDAD